MAKQEKVYWPENEDTNIVPVEIVDEVKSSMLQYGMSVLVGRALPDVRDGLKPVHRRILYTMYENGLTPEKAYRKCADTVGSVLGRYHPHGDSSVYDAMVRMAQDFSLRYPLIDGHGNFGNIDGYPPAAYRYTESKMNRLSLHMLDDIEKDTVDCRSLLFYLFVFRSCSLTVQAVLLLVWLPKFRHITLAKLLTVCVILLITPKQNFLNFVSL